MITIIINVLDILESENLYVVWLYCNNLALISLFSFVNTDDMKLYILPHKKR